ENDQSLYLPIAAGRLRSGDNVVKIESSARSAQTSDDIRVGQIWLDSRPVNQVLSEATLEIAVIDGDSGVALPARITIVDEQETLQPVAAVSDDRLAVRAGVIYTTDGKVQTGLPAGTYNVYAGRGFEYS